MWDKLLLVGLGALVGVLSGMGVGGGSLLVVLLSAFLGVEQQTAQGVNLFYFLPTAVVAVGIHLKKGTIDKKTAVAGSAAGLVTALAGSLIALWLDASLLKKLFAGLIFVAGLSELFSSPKDSD